MKQISHAHTHYHDDRRRISPSCCDNIFADKRNSNNEKKIKSHSRSRQNSKPAVIKNKEGCNKKLHPKDFDATFPKCHNMRLFEDTLLVKNDTLHSRRSSYLSSKADKRKETSFRRQNKKNNEQEKTTTTKKQMYPPGMAPCTQCHRVYSIEDLKIHSDQCTILLGENDEMKIKVDNYNNDDDDDDEISDVGERRRRRRARLTTQANIYPYDNMPFFHPGLSRSSFSSSSSSRFSFVGCNGSTGNREEDFLRGKSRNAAAIDEEKEKRTKNKIKIKKHEQAERISALSSYNEHETKWSEFERSMTYDENYHYGAKTIDVTIIPFLPDNLVGFQAVGLTPFSPKQEKILRVRAAMIRWHPDKFQQTYGGKFCPTDRNKIMEKVTECFQRINALKDEVFAN